MADNLTTTTTLSSIPSGSVIGTDEVTIGAVLQHVQRMKLVDGADGGTGLIGGDAANGLDVDVTRLSALVAGEAHVGEIGGRSRIATGNFTRPADTITYTAGDAVTNSTTAPVALSIAGCARINQGSGTIVAATLITSVAPTLKGMFEAWIFAGTAAPTAQNDNAAFTPADAAIQNDLVGIIPFSLAYVGDVGASGNVVYRGEVPAPLPYQCGSGVTTLWALFVVRNAYVPANAERLDLHLNIIQD